MRSLFQIIAVSLVRLILVLRDKQIGFLEAWDSFLFQGGFLSSTAEKTGGNSRL